MNNKDTLIISKLSEFEPIAQALSNTNRLKILTLLRDGEHKISDISKKLNMPMPTTTVNIQKLEESGIIECTLKSGKHGKQKICYLRYSELRVNFLDQKEEKAEPLNLLEQSVIKQKQSIATPKLFEKKLQIPIGSYSFYNVNPPWGVATVEKIVNDDSIQRIFSSESKEDFQVIWFNDGSLTYNISTGLENCKIESIKISFEACSEHVFFNKNWPTDISILINNQTIATYTTSEAHLTDNRFRNPDWWPEEKPQYGEYISFELDESGTYTGGQKHGSFRLSDIADISSDFSLTISAENDLQNPRGIMIFGESFGEYQQDIEVLIKYRET